MLGTLHRLGSGSKAAFGITHLPTGAQHSSKANEAAAALVPLPQGGSRGCGAAAPPFSAHCSHPTAAELCVRHLGNGSPLCTTSSSSFTHLSFSAQFIVSASVLSHLALQLSLYHPKQVSQSKGSPLLGPAPASCPAKLSLLAKHDSAFPTMHHAFFLQGWLKISQFDLPYAKECDV